MSITETGIAGCFILVPQVFKDDRGYFFEHFNLRDFEKGTGIRPGFVQDNQSYSTRGVLRGLHFQKGIHAQSKLVSVPHGEVLDIVVDLRPHSSTYGVVERNVLSSDNKRQLYIPKGCAHGFVTLSGSAVFYYKCDTYYKKESEGGVLYNDPDLNIDWQLDETDILVSEKDRKLPSFKEMGSI